VAAGPLDSLVTDERPPTGAFDCGAAQADAIGTSVTIADKMTQDFLLPRMSG
jgi:hypothetical protein